MNPTTMIYSSMTGIIAIILVIFITLEMKYKHFVNIREVVNNRKYIIRDKAKHFRDGEGNEFWMLKKEKDKIKKRMPIPPPEAIELTKKGRYVIDVYRTEQGEYVFVKDDSTSIELPNKKMSEEELINWRKDNKVITPLKPFTEGQRMALVNNIAKAKNRHKKDWKEQLPIYVSFGLIAVVLIGGFIFLPDIITTYTKGSQQISASMEHYENVRHRNLLEEQKNWQSISEGIQVINEQQQKNEERINELEEWSSDNE